MRATKVNHLRGRNSGKDDMVFRVVQALRMKGHDITYQDIVTECKIRGYKYMPGREEYKWCLKRLRARKMI